MNEVESVSETRASEGERLSGNQSQEAVDEIEDHEVDADARTEESVTRLKLFTLRVIT